MNFGREINDFHKWNNTINLSQKPSISDLHIFTSNLRNHIELSNDT